MEKTNFFVIEENISISNEQQIKSVISNITNYDNLIKNIMNELDYPYNFSLGYIYVMYNEDKSIIGVEPGNQKEKGNDRDTNENDSIELEQIPIIEYVKYVVERECQCITNKNDEALITNIENRSTSTRTFMSKEAKDIKYVVMSEVIRKLNEMYLKCLTNPYENLNQKTKIEETEPEKESNIPTGNEQEKKSINVDMYKIIIEEVEELIYDKKFEEAWLKLDELKEFKKKDDKYYLFSGIVEFNKNKKSKISIENFLECIKMNPNNELAYLNLGIQKYNDFTSTEYKEIKLELAREAEKYFDEALKINPNLADALRRKGDCLDDYGKRKEAIELMDQAIIIFEKNIEELKNVLDCEKDKNSNKAEKISNKLKKLKNILAGAYNSRAFTKRNLNLNDEAIEDYKKSIEIDKFEFAYNNLGVHYMNLKRNDESLHILSQGKKLYENNAKISANYNKVSTLTVEEKIKNYEKDITLNSKIYWIHERKAQLYLELELKNYEEALKSFEASIDDNNPHPQDTLKYIADIYNELKEYKKAQEIEKALEQNPNPTYEKAMLLLEKIKSIQKKNI